MRKPQIQKDQSSRRRSAEPRDRRGEEDSRREGWCMDAETLGWPGRGVSGL